MNNLRTTDTMEHTENFDNLWASLKDQVAKARSAQAEHGMCTVSTKSEYWPGRVSVMQPTSGSATVSVNVSLLASCGTKMTAEELRKHAAHCLAAAEIIEEAVAEPQHA